MRHLLALLVILVCSTAGAQVPPAVMQDLLVAAVRPTGSGATNVTSGLMAWWKFDEVSGFTAADSSGNGRTLNLSNSPAWTSGMVGGGLSFNGTNSFLKIAASTGLTCTNVTICAWVNASAGWVIDLPANVYSLSLGTTNHSFAGRPAGNASTIMGWNSQDFGVARSASTWSHIAFTYTGTNVTFYVNGQGASTNHANGNIYGSNYGANSGLYVGVSGYWVNADPGNVANCGYLTGKLDELRIYSRALNSAEVQQTYQYRGP